MVTNNFIAIEGVIGAGKTTLASKLASDLDANLILEGFSDNPFLPPFYENKERYAFPLELYFMAERFQQLKTWRAQSELFRKQTISDYLFIKSLIFAQLNLSEDELKLYSRLFHIINPSLPQPDLIIYLYSPVEKLLENISKRGRGYEKNISPGYLDSIHRAYMEYFKNSPHLKIAIIDTTNLDFAHSKEQYEWSKSILATAYHDGINIVPLPR